MGLKEMTDTSRLEDDEAMPAVAEGYCHCGCGQRTNLAPENSKRSGWIKGQPMRFVAGHNSRRNRAMYRVENRGYETPCWIWQRARAHAGHGRYWHPGKGMDVPAHRFFYEQRHGPVPGELEMDHLCRVTCCVNPDHLEPVTAAVNAQRGIRARLTPEKVRDMRRAREEVEFPYAKLADAFGVDTMTCYLACTRQTWKNV